MVVRPFNHGVHRHAENVRDDLAVFSDRAAICRAFVDRGVLGVWREQRVTRVHQDTQIGVRGLAAVEIHPLVLHPAGMAWQGVVVRIAKIDYRQLQLPEVVHAGDAKAGSSRPARIAMMAITTREPTNRLPDGVLAGARLHWLNRI